MAKSGDWVGIIYFLSQLIPTGDVPNFCLFLNYEPIKRSTNMLTLIFAGTRPRSFETFGLSSSWQTVEWGWSGVLLGQANWQSTVEWGWSWVLLGQANWQLDVGLKNQAWTRVSKTCKHNQHAWGRFWIVGEHLKNIFLYFVSFYNWWQITHF